VAEPLKLFFAKPMVERLAHTLANASPGFDERAFVRDACRGLDALELMPRGRHIMQAMAKHLPPSPEHAIEIIVRSLATPNAANGSSMSGFFYLPHTMYVAEHGLVCFERSMAAQHALTQRFTAEFSIRAFIDAFPEETLAVLSGWVRDESEHVRRLVSEGTRPRLPWASRLRAYDVDRYEPLLESLRDDESEYVRRSVANHLNDIGKEHPARLVTLASRWMIDAPAPRRALLAHALRSRVKAGDRDAIALLGHDADASVEATLTAKPRKVAIGDVTVLEVTLTSHARASCVVDLRVGYLDTRGVSRPKVRKGKKLVLEAGERQTFTYRLPFTDGTTRTHHAGVHVIEALVNGTVCATCEVTLTASRKAAH
jgi:3-methyladenine DNA glycosylase AlkC